MKLKLAGFEIGVSADPARVARIKQSALYRQMVKPGLDLLNRRKSGNVAEQPPPPAVTTPDPEDPEAAELWEQVGKLGWYHTIDLGHGVATPGFVDERSTRHRFGLPEDMAGMRALDIGTFDGFWAFEMERRGASEVVGIDVDSPLEYDISRLDKQRLRAEAGSEEQLRDRANAKLVAVGAQLPGEGFRLAKRLLDSKAERRTLDVYTLSPETLGMFDVVFIGELLLHLRDPQTVLENLFSVTRRFAIVAEPYDPELEALERPVSEFIGRERVGAWWGHSIKSMRKMMQVAGFDPIEEVARLPVANKLGNFSKVVLRGRVPS